MGLVKDTLISIRNEADGFSFGEPWRFNEKSLSVVVPIVRKVGEDVRRGYITLAESEMVALKDTGQIDKIVVENKEEKPVYIGAGEIMAGDTQARAVVRGYVLMPKQTEDIKVMCIHSSRGISSSASMATKGYVPRSVRTNLRRGQGEVWNSIRDSGNIYNMSTLNYMALGDVDVPNAEEIAESFKESDDLFETRDKYNEIVEDVIKKIPLIGNQVGIVIIDAKGFVSMDAFDLKDSWTAIRTAITKGASIDIAQFEEEHVFEYKPEIAVQKIMQTLSKDYSEKILHENGYEVIELTSDGFFGEAVVLDAEVIHLRIARI